MFEYKAKAMDGQQVDMDIPTHSENQGYQNWHDHGFDSERISIVPPIVAPEESDRIVVATRAKNSFDQSDRELMAGLQLLTGDLRIYFPLDVISSVCARPAIKPIPCSQPWVAGLANIDGQLVTVIDLSRFIGLEEQVDNQYVVLIKRPDNPVGLLVNGVPRIKCLNPEMTSKDIPRSLSIISDSIDGIIKENNILSVIISVRKFLSSDRFVNLSR
ncbi:MAG: chemotaxis protein CheW [Gammaproteobacteria bacterium]